MDRNPGECRSGGMWKKGWLWGFASHTRVTLVGVRLDIALGDLQVAFVRHLVHGVFATRENFAGVAVAITVISS